MKKKDIVFIRPEYSMSAKYIKESGYDVNSPYKGNTFLLRIFRELHFRLNIPFKSLWYNNVDMSSKKVLILNNSLLIPNYLKWLKKKNKNSRIILYYSDPVKATINPALIDNSWCEKWTIDPDDAKKYGLKFYYGGDFYFRQNVIKKTKAVYDILFIGRDKDRMRDLLELEKLFNNMGLSTYFHITAKRRLLGKKNKNYKPLISYDEVLKYLSKSKSVLQLEKGCQKGVTLRIKECLINKIKLISDNRDLLKYDFYNPSNIFIIGYDNFSRLPFFINSPYEEVSSTIDKSLFFDMMIPDLIGEEVTE